ncbi:hypothetical protein LCGC14_2043980 [marine sediment metagenome]|uniref:Uncharacterized protein n=1 Tax=marine sediment metagenome TaxID=412755 RepID=A0A0F9EQW8_9ZZZZ
MFEEVHFLNKEQIRLYLCNGIKIYQNGYYWQVTGMGTEKVNSITNETLELKRIDHVVDEIWSSKDEFEVNID